MSVFCTLPINSQQLSSFNRITSTIHNSSFEKEPHKISISDQKIRLPIVYSRFKIKLILKKQC